MSQTPQTATPWIKRGDRKPDLKVTVWDEAGTSLAPVVSWRLIGVMRGAVVFVDAAPTVTTTADPSRVILTHAWAAGDTDEVGSLAVEPEATWPGGLPQSFPVVYVDVLPDLG